MTLEISIHPERKWAFVSDIRKETRTKDTIAEIQSALNCLAAYEIVASGTDTPPGFKDFLSEYRSDIPVTDGVSVDAVIARATRYHDALNSRDASDSVHVRGILKPAHHAIKTIGMWLSLGKVHKQTGSSYMTESVTALLGEDAKTSRRILESLAVRVTAGEFVTKPMLGMVGVLTVAHGLPGWLESDAGVFGLIAMTVLLAIAKTEQDIDSHLHKKRYMTVETNVATEVLGYELRKSAYFVRMAWLAPVLATAVIAHVSKGIDMQPILITQNLMYLGPMALDFLLRMDLLETVTDSFKSLLSYRSKRISQKRSS